MSQARTAHRLVTASFVVLLGAPVLYGQGREPVTHEAIWLMPRVGAPVLSPDGKWVACSVTLPAYDDKDQSSDLWIVAADGSVPPRQITTTRAAESAVAWNPDSRRLAFVTRGDQDDATQIYVLDAIGGGPATRVTSLSTGAGSPKWRPDGQALLFTSLVYPNTADDDANRREAAARSDLKYRVRAYDTFPARQWNGQQGEWLDDRQPHLFVQTLESGARPKDLLAGTQLVKQVGYGSATDGSYTGTPLRSQLDPIWTPDGASILFVATTERHLAASANVHPHIFQIAAAGGEPRQLTTGNLSYGDPRFSADGRILFVGVTDDHDQIYSHNRIAAAPWPWTTQPALVDARFDRSAGSYQPAADGRSVYVIAEDGKLYALVRGRNASTIAAPERGAYGNIRFASAASGDVLVATFGSSTQPNEIARIDPATGQHRLLTSFAVERAARLNWKPLRTFTFTSSRGKELRSLMAVPPNLDETQKYPLLVVIHGGPHSYTRDQMSTDWSNFHLLAERGYVVLATDYTGSTGYGEAFARAIALDPAVSSAREINEAADAAIRRFPFIDGSRQCAVGASWGGFLVNWMQATTTRYRCLINLVGAVNVESQWGSTDLPYYRELIYGGPPWEHGAAWEQNPIRFARQFKTPVLISVGERDYRMPMNQALEYWSVLNRQKVPGRLLVWPDEGHTLMNGENSRRLSQEIANWLARWLQPAAPGSRP